MPIIPVKDNPPTKSFESSILEKEGIWCVAKVKPQHEKKVAFNFLDLGIDYYLPYYLKSKKRKDRGVRNSIRVLFPSYVPFIGSESSRDFLWLKGIEKILPVKAQQRFKNQLNYIFLAIESGISIEPVPKTKSFVKGESAKIVSGQLIGAAGIVTNIQNEKSKVMLSTDILGRAKVIVDTVNVEKIKFEKIAEELSSKIHSESLPAKNIVLQKINNCAVLASCGLNCN
ncbi:MAG: hypothetical protein FWD13_07470 [Treponema sp.]|nr:hypothetical protein [Treponema sp.]